MPQTILITGASSGIGMATARLFADNGWNVVATMRNPADAGDLADRANVLVAALDVTKPETIAYAVDQAISTYGQIDVLLNNAGYGAYGPLEAFPMERIERQFDTNVIGLLAVTKAVLPHMRAQKSGTIVNISSIGGQMTFPLGTLYHGTKFAVEGLSEALHYELEACGVKVKIVEPGMINTDFGGRSFDFVVDESMPDYLPVVAGMQAAMGSFGAQASEPELVAEVIQTAVTDGTSQLRYRAGADAETLLSARKAQDDETFIGGIKAGMGL
ncbi:SDR family oxidoreductase [Rhodobacteraceae bacterium M382]|nr:SDR family oxidoreductase [Rhodobacteraceae bacterium M382]